MTLSWVQLALLLVLYFVAYTLGRRRGRIGRPGDNQRGVRLGDPRVVGDLSGLRSTRESPEPDVHIIGRLDEGLTLRSYRSKTDPTVDQVEALHYEATDEYTLVAGLGHLVSGEHIPGGHFRDLWEPVATATEVLDLHKSVKIQNRAIAQIEPLPEEFTQLAEQEWKSLAESLDFPVEPRTYDGPCTHEAVMAQVYQPETATVKAHYKVLGPGHKVRCAECRKFFFLPHLPNHRGVEPSDSQSEKTSPGQTPTSTSE